MSAYTDNLRRIAAKINQDSLAISNKWQRKQFRDSALAAYNEDERYYLRAYLHMEMVENQNKARRENMSIKL